MKSPVIQPAESPNGQIRFHYNHDEFPTCRVDKGTLAGLRHRTVVDHRTGAASTSLWQESHMPGFHVPLHRHDCEEIISVVRGEIQAEVDGRRFTVGAGESILLPPWSLHGFCVTSLEPVYLHAFFSSSNPRIFRADGTESTPPWEGGATNHLDSPGD